MNEFKKNIFAPYEQLSVKYLSIFALCMNLLSRMLDTNNLVKKWVNHVCISSNTIFALSMKLSMKLLLK